MTTELAILLWTAVAVAFLHTLLGPDHYIPFVAMSRALGWSRGKTVVVTLTCGLGHVLSSVILGTLGIALGLAVTRVQFWESYRGQLAGWLLISFGLVYSVWGLRRASRGQPHSHLHVHADGSVHSHLHAHEREHVHVHLSEASAQGSPMRRVTPWVLFTILVFGPCEPLIPLLMYPAAQKSVLGVVLVTTVFATATLLTMVAAVLAISLGVAWLPTAALERYTHALAGAAILFCGLAVRILML